MEDPSDKAVSRHILLQLAVRAVRRVHLDAQLLNIGQVDDDADPERIRQINQGVGIEAALETTVRDALAQEFNASKLGHGWKIRAGARPNAHGSHYFGIIDREVPYKLDDAAPDHVDLQYGRVAGPGESVGPFPVAPVELKRARIVRLDLRDGRPQGRKDIQTTRIQDDVRKLARYVRAERLGKLVEPDFRRAEPVGSREDWLQPQILVWGVRDDAVEFMNAVFEGVKDCGCGALGKILYEWLPASWDLPTLATPGIRPTVATWIWVAAASISVTGDGCTNASCACHVGLPS